MIVEDDYDSESRFGGRPLEPLQSLDREGHVVYVGSFSKTLLPALRLGFLVAPGSLRPALRAAERLADGHGDPLTQAAPARFMEEGLPARHVRRATREYASRRERITALLRRDFSGLLLPVPSAAGLHLCARLAPEAADPDRVVPLARPAAPASPVRSAAALLRGRSPLGGGEPAGVRGPAGGRARRAQNSSSGAARVTPTAASSSSTLRETTSAGSSPS
ncbi:hypothetical protein GCM10010466_38510 [Planomonospora alba]|uniref:Uncharacterized protein n=1 Tax=Planomonospora alba TaxID=161354 RepID=A0ABP6NDG0_9ACTN